MLQASKKVEQINGTGHTHKAGIDFKQRASAPLAAGAKPFFLGVTLTFESENDKALFISYFSVVADFVKEHEPTTLSYELYESDKIVTQVFILERYIDNRSYLDIHRTSQPFLQFKERISTLKIHVSGHSYYESGIGFL